MTLNDQVFTVRPEHVRLLRRLNISWNEGEVGAPGADTKRPYGNSDIYSDLAEVLGIEALEIEGDPSWREFSLRQREKMDQIHREMETVLKILVNQAELHPGTYHSDWYGHNWNFISRDE